MRILTVVLLIGSVLLAVPTAASAEDPPRPPVSVTLFEPFTTLDLQRPGHGDIPWTRSFPVASSSDGRFLLVSNEYAERSFSLDALYDYSRHDLATGEVVHFSPTWNGDPLDRYVMDVDMSDDGRHLVFATDSSNVVFGGVGNGHGYWFDIETRTPTLITVRPDGTHGVGRPSDITMTPDGRYAVFSAAANLIDGTGGLVHVHRWDRRDGTLTLVSAAFDGTPGDARLASFPVAGHQATVSDDGRFVAFVAYSGNLVPGSLTTTSQGQFPEKAYLKDLETGEIELLTRDESGPLDQKSLSAHVTSDGEAVVYNTFPFGGAGTIWRFDRRTGERTVLFDGEPYSWFASIVDVVGDGPTVVIDERQRLRDGGLVAAVSAIEDEFDPGRHLTMLDDDGRWARRQTEGGGEGSDLEVFTRSATGVRPDGCGGLGLGFDPGVRPLDDQIIRLYEAVFGRPPDAAGLDYWIEQRASGVSMTSIAEEFTRSDEWASRYGTATTTADVVALLYQNVLDREPDEAGRQFWIESGLSVSELIVAFSDSQENIDKTATAPPMSSAQGVVCRLYLGVFGRAPDAAGFEFWTNRIDAGQSVRSVAAEFAASPEWRSTYGADPTSFSLVAGMYENVFGRAPDVDGLRFWVGLADDGLTTEALLEQFIQSAEFVQSTGTAP